MEITEVRVKLVDGGQDKLRAFCSITIDDAFVVRDLKVIEGTKGLFVAMPSRKLTTRCSRCGFKNQVRSNYCNECGTTLPPESSQRLEGKGKLHADIAHPINTECRERLQARVVESYLEEVDASKQPGYRPRDLDDEGGLAEEPAESAEWGGRGEAPAARAAERPERTERSERPEPRPRERAPTFELDRTPVLADRSFAERGPVERGPLGRGDVGSARSGAAASERTPIERTASDRPAVEHGPSVRGPSERTSSGRGASEPGSFDRAPRERADPDRPEAERPESDRPRRPSGRDRGPLAEMPPPDDNFSAGIF